VVRGSFLALFKDRARARRYVAIVLVGVPVWYVIGILAASAPEIGQAMGMADAPQRPRALMICYTCLGVGDVLAGAASQWLRSRRKALAIFLVATGVTTAAYFALASSSTTMFYAMLAAVSIAGGYWAVFVTTASEQFGTNLRAMATTTAPNFVRGALVLMNLAYAALRPEVGVVTGALLVGVGVLLCLIAAAAYWKREGSLRPSPEAIAMLIDRQAAPVARRIASRWELSERMVGALNDQSAAESTSIGLLSPLGRALLLGRELGALSVLARAGAMPEAEARAKAMACGAPPRLVERIWVRLAQQQPA